MMSINLYYNHSTVPPLYLLQTGSAAELILDRVPEHVVVMLVEDRKHMKIVPEPRAGIWGRRGCHAIEDSRRGEPAIVSEARAEAAKSASPSIVRLSTVMNL